MTGDLKRHGLCVVISAPSGGGKTSVIRALMEKFSTLQHSISYTTRHPRNDADLKDYTFISEADFDSMLDDCEFLEWAIVHRNRYGTRRKDLIGLLEKGYDVILDIDVQGARQMKKNYKDAVYIFIQPPSVAVLEERLRARASDSEAVIRQRLENARLEMAASYDYDYVVVNSDLKKTVDTIGSILIAEHCRTSRLILSEDGMPV